MRENRQFVGDGRKRRTLEIVTEGKNAWPAMNNIALSAFICLQASIRHIVHVSKRIVAWSAIIRVNIIILFLY